MTSEYIIYMLIIFLIVVLMLLLGYLAIIIIKGKANKRSENTVKESTQGKKENATNNTKVEQESIFKFMEFDDIKDDMIIRKNREQYVMVIKCKGVNYDLMSEEEKVSVESGFVQFLNSLRFPIQLYVQTSSLNLKEIIDEYQTRIEGIHTKLREVEMKIQNLKAKGQNKGIDKLNFERRRIQNVLEYTIDIADYISRMSSNNNILQQKTYVIVSYYASEADKTENLSDQELDNICFSELYTRTQTVVRSLSSAGVMGKILDSKELAELVYVAYNRDESEIMQLSKALDAEYDALYSTGKDVLDKKKKLAEDQIELDAVNLAADSIDIASENIKKAKMVGKKSLEVLEEYKDQMTDELYKETQKEIMNTTKRKIVKIKGTKE